MNISSWSVDIEKRVETTTGDNTGKFHIKLWVTYVVVENGKKKWKQVPYQTKQFATLKDWEIINDNKKKTVSTEVGDIRRELTKIKAKADNIITELKVRDRKTFELFFLAEHDLQMVKGQYELKINKLKQVKPEPKWSTIEKYETSLNSLIEFSHPALTFQEMDVEFLEDYLDWYTSAQYEDDKLLSRANKVTGAAINLRHARAIYNQAIKLKVISPELYPFGLDKFVIPEGGDEVKKFLDEGEITKFIEYQPETDRLRYYHDFACFIYFGNGMNVVDMLTLTDDDDKGDYFLKERVKTAGKKKKIRRMIIPIHPIMREIIQRRRAPRILPLDPSAYIFPVLSRDMDAKTKYDQRKTFINELDKALAVISERLQFSIKVTSYVLRHSHAWAVMQMGGTTEELQDNFGHGKKETTEHYKHGFSLERKKQISEGLYKKKA
jgi:integrase